MRRLKVCATRVAVLVLSAVLLPHAAGAQTLKVLDWNTHHGVGTDGDYDIERFVPWIVRSGANVVSLNEVERFTGWGNEDQPARYAAMLRSATGKTWYYTFAQRDGASTGQGNLILTTFPLEAAGKHLLSYSRSVARAQIVVNGVRVNIFSTHLDADSSARRATQMAELKALAASYSQQHIFAGDFNAWPGATEIANMTAFAYDAWAVAKAMGTATAYAGNEAGNTRNSRIDYVFYSKSATRLALRGAQVFDTRDSSGVMPSDHRPVMASFQIGSTTTTVAPPAPADFDGDRRSDLSVYRPTTGEWFATRPGGGLLQLAWGALGDVPASCDFDGDGRADAVVFRPLNGTWYVRSTASGATWALRWGQQGDIPVARDYDGDGRADLAVFRPGEGTWYVRYSSNGSTVAVRWGLPEDIPVQGDYDGDDKGDFIVFRPSNGTWYVRNSSNGSTLALRWGLSEDRPAAADYDGDGRTDLAVFRPSSGVWYIRYADNGATFSFRWGLSEDRPVSADYDGDGRSDIAVFRPSSGVWYLRYSANGATTALQFGSGTDVPVAAR